MTNNSWQQVKLEDIADNLDSRRVPISKENRSMGSVPYYGATGIVDYVNDHIFDEELLLVGEDGADWSPFANTSYIIRGKSWVNNHAHVLKVTKANIGFLMEFLNYADLTVHTSGTTRGKLNKSDLMNLQIPLPDRPIQDKIYLLLASLNEQIIKTDEIIQKTEVLKQGVMGQLLGNKNKLWDEYILDDLCNFTTGKLNSNMAVHNGNYPFFTCAQETFAIDSYSFDTKAVLLAGNNAAGIYSVKYYEGKFDAYQRTYVITAKDESILDYYFLKELLNIRLNMLRDYSVGTNTKFLTLKLLLNIKVPLPPIETQRKISETLLSIDIKNDLDKKQVNELFRLKKSLMRDIFSQKVQIN